MNKPLPFLFLLAGLSAFGSKDSDPSPTPTDPFLGHWQAVVLRSFVSSVPLEDYAHGVRLPE